jgi:hypothetical protein
MMAKTKTTTKTKKVTPADIEWNDYVLDLLQEDEKIKGNPTTDGLRRIFETALNCVIIDSTSQVVQSPDMHNEKRATVVHDIEYVILGEEDALSKRKVNGAADVYWGNCDKIYRNHPVAVAETRAEGRALRRGLRLRKVVAAEEIAENIEDDVDGATVGRISQNQKNFIDVLSKRLDINTPNLIQGMDYDINNLLHDEAISIIRKLSEYQQKTQEIPEKVKGYVQDWK